nr:hypothetical protein [Nanoarchaeum sp.]
MNDDWKVEIGKKIKKNNERMLRTSISISIGPIVIMLLFLSNQWVSGIIILAIGLYVYFGAPKGSKVTLIDTLAFYFQEFVDKLDKFKDNEDDYKSESIKLLGKINLEIGDYLEKRANLICLDRKEEKNFNELKEIREFSKKIILFVKNYEKNKQHKDQIATSLKVSASALNRSGYLDEESIKPIRIINKIIFDFTDTEKEGLKKNFSRQKIKKRAGIIFIFGILIPGISILVHSLNSKFSVDAEIGAILVSVITGIGLLFQKNN